MRFILQIDARKSVTAETSSAYTGAAAGAVAAQSVPSSVGRWEMIETGGAHSAPSLVMLSERNISECPFLLPR